VHSSPEQNGQASALDRLTRLQALTASLSEAVTSMQVADAILTHAAAVLDATAGVVARLCENRREVVVFHETGYSTPVVDTVHRFPIDACLPLCDAVRDCVPVLLMNRAEHDARYPGVGRPSGIETAGALVALPLVVRGEAIGGIGLRFATERDFTNEDRAFLLTVAGLCAQALERAHLYDTEHAARERAERVERALRESEERLRAIIDNCPSAIFVKDPEGRYLLANRACEVYWGKPVEQVIGKTAHDYFPPTLAKTLGDDDQQVLATGNVLRYEAVMPAGDATVTALTVKFPLRDANGKPHAVCGIATDITDMKRAGEALRKSEERFTQFMQHLPGLAWIKDIEGHYVFANDAALVAFGTRKEQLYGKVDDEIFAQATASQFREHDRRALESNIGVRVVETLNHPNGELRYSIVSKFAIPGPDGQAAFVGGMAIDATEEMQTRAVLQESEERFRATFDQAAVGIAHVGPDGRWLRVNRKLCEIVGYRADELLALTFQDITHPEDLEADLTQVRRLLAGEIETYSMEKRYFRKDRSLVWINLTVSLVRTPDGQPKYFISVVEDITEKKAVRDALRESEERLRDHAGQLQQADRRKDEFLATLAHELRNPLAPLRNGLQLIKLAGNKPQVAEPARAMMERQLEHMVHLIDDLLDVSRITRGKLELRRQRVELATIVQSAIESSRLMIETSGHQLTVTLPPQTTELHADPVRLAQVFTNLLTNAAKYTDRGGRIWLSAVRQGGDVVVTIKDNGIGIAPQHLPRLFEMFNQVTPARQRSQGGLGIGLSLVKGLVEMHGGTVQVHSDGPDKGSEFIVCLPLAVEHAANPTTDAPIEGEPHAGTLRILVADDNRDAADSLAMLLKIQGHELHTVHDGQEAVEAAAWFCPDAAFLDIGMPKLNGLEVARHIRSQLWGKKIVLVAVTGWGQEEDKLRSNKSGFDHHLIKPVDPVALEKLLAVLTNRPING
jgi:PAS domain S-box-containing protein